MKCILVLRGLHAHFILMLFKKFLQIRKWGCRRDGDAKGGSRGIGIGGCQRKVAVVCPSPPCLHNLLNSVTFQNGWVSPLPYLCSSKRSCISLMILVSFPSYTNVMAKPLMPNRPAQAT